jgi:hypothetical protein
VEQIGNIADLPQRPVDIQFSEIGGIEAFDGLVPESSSLIHE